MELSRFLDIYSDTNSILDNYYKKAEDILEDCIFVFDTNALLLPYTDRGRSLTEIEKLLKKLCSENRAFFPAQVLREFAKNRSLKLSEIIKELDDYKSQIKLQKPPENRHILFDLDEYKKLKSSYEKVNKEVKDYIKEATVLSEKIKDSYYNDPLTLLYKKYIIKDRIINNVNYDKSLIQEFECRSKVLLPPGYKDKSKDDNVEGDYIIWKEILELGKKVNKSVVFVSGDEKADWCSRTSGKALYPRFELCYEFKKYTNGYDFGIIQIGRLCDYIIERLCENKENTTKEISRINGWMQDEQDWCYYENGTRCTNAWKKSGNGWFYIDDDGYIARDKIIEDNNELRYVDGTGRMATNLLCTISGQKMFFESDGRAFKQGKKEFGTKVYYFENGVVIEES